MLHKSYVKLRYTSQIMSSAIAGGGVWLLVEPEGSCLRRRGALQVEGSNGWWRGAIANGGGQSRYYGGFVWWGINMFHPHLMWVSWIGMSRYHLDYLVCFKIDDISNNTPQCQQCWFPNWKHFKIPGACFKTLYSWSNSIFSWNLFH